MPDCEHCQGSGVDPDDEESVSPCPECDGSGYIEDDDDFADTGVGDEPS